MSPSKSVGLTGMQDSHYLLKGTSSYNSSLRLTNGRSTVYEDFKAILSPACSLQRSPSSSPATQQSTVLQQSPRLRRSKPSMRLHEENLTAPSASSASSEEISIRLTERPRNEPLFEHLDWHGNVRNARRPRIRVPPPVSFNRYVPDDQGPLRATTDVIVDSRTGAPIVSYRSHKSVTTPPCVALREGPIEAPENTLRTQDASPRAHHQALPTPTVDQQRPIEKPVSSADPAALMDGSYVKVNLADPASPPSSEAKHNSETRPDPCVSINQARFSGGSTDTTETTSSVRTETTETTSSVRTDKLPSVTNPQGMAAYYGRYLEAAGSLASSLRSDMSSSTLVSSNGTSPREPDSQSRKNGTKLYVFPPNANKPLPPIPTPYGSAEPAQSWAVAAFAEVSQTAWKVEVMPHNTSQLEEQLLPIRATCEPSRLPRNDTPSSGLSADNSQVSCWSDSEDGDDDVGVNIREIDPKAFGRAKYMGMRPGCEGWDEYRNQMLKESRTPKTRAIRDDVSGRRVSWFKKGIRKLSFGL